jgi:hypothetical protein
MELMLTVQSSNAIIRAETKQERQYNVPIRRIRVTTVVVEKQYGLDIPCSCDLRHPACKAMRRIILLSVACPAPAYFHIIS